MKEIKLALSKGYKVELICFEFKNWSKEINETLKQELDNVKLILIPAGRTPIFPWFFSVCLETIFRLAGNLFRLPVPVLSQAVSRRSDLLLKSLKKVSKPNLVIGHNPGAMWATLKAAEKFNCQAGFDIEDYHIGEGVNVHLQNLTKQLMSKLLPRMSYVSFAAPLILEKVKNDLKIENGNWFTILNYFPASDFIEPTNTNQGPLKLVWFSQNITSGRGLELILPFVKTAGNKIELHLIGNLNPSFYQIYLKDISNIHIHPPLNQIDLHHKLEQFDIGLALDINVDTNRDLTITNKFIAYLQAGLFVVATDTSAQKSFLRELPGYGTCINYKKNDTEAIFEKIINQKKEIRDQKKLRYNNLFDRNWEKTSISLLNAWAAIS